MKISAPTIHRWTTLFLVFGLFITQAGLSLAQQQKSAISGSVTDPSGAVLHGAEVSVPEKDIHVKTNEQGLFFIPDLAPGKYTLTISYVGFAEFNQAVDLLAGRTANVDAKLLVQSAHQEVVVSAPRVTGEAEAINVERSADNILQVLPAEIIRSLPNANMADALGRMPSVTLERDEGEGKYVQVRGTEPRLTNTTIDGVNVPSPEPGVRQIKFDAIAADIVQEVQVSKTLQANMDGDGIGGSLNLVTKTANDRPSISVAGMGGYTPIIHGRGLTEDTFTVGQRFGKSKKFGLLIGGSYDWNGRGIDDIEPVPDVATLANGATQSWKDGMDIREYQYFRSRWGLAGSADYRIADGSGIYFRALYSDFKNYGDRWAYTLVDNTPGIQVLNPGNVGCTTNSAGVTTAHCTSAPSFNAQLRNPDIGVGSMVLGGSHVLTTTWYSWEIAAARSFYGNSPYSTAVFNSTLSSSGCQYAPNLTTNVYLPKWSPACYAEGYNPGNLALNNINRSLGHSAQLNLQIAGSGARRYHIGSRTAVIEYGGKFRNEHKFADTYVLTLTPNGAIPLSTFPNRLTNSNYYNGGTYPLGYNADYEDVIAYANRNPGAFTSASTSGQDPSEYSLVEKVSAGYVMNTIDISNRLRLIAGLRAEVTSDGVRNFAFGSYACATSPSGSCSSITPNSFSGSYYNLLPSASLRYAVGNNTYLRFVYARGLSRPDPTDIAQALSWTDSGNGANRYSASFGNANLKAETGDDIDVLFEHYLQPFGMISAGYFYKALRNPIISRTFELANYQPPGGPLSNYLATQPINAGSGWLSGFEANYLQHFSSLPGILGGLGLSANYGYTASRANGIPGRSDHPRLLRTSPNAFNISPTFDRGRVSIRIGMSYNQASIYSYQYTDGTAGGVNGPLSDLYFYSHFQVDAQGSVRLSHGLTFVMYGLNLNNEVFGFYQGSPQYMIQREYYQPTVAAGFRWSPNPSERR
ncbi:MAG: TonB-dependent receptor [Acidobacteriaceae bacterium]|nr:TonB-dependent receptor [Acidobacteriaceae bacterium]